MAYVPSPVRVDKEISFQLHANSPSFSSCTLGQAVFAKIGRMATDLNVIHDRDVSAAATLGLCGMLRAAERGIREATEDGGEGEGEGKEGRDPGPRTASASETRTIRASAHAPPVWRPCQMQTSIKFGQTPASKGRSSAQVCHFPPFPPFRLANHPAPSQHAKMASTASKSKKPRNKPPKGRPAATSAISQPTVEDASTTHSLSSFSPNGELFAFLSLAVDKHRLRVYDTVTSQCIAELVLDSSRVASICWARFDASQSDEGPKRKRKRNGEDAEEGAHKPPLPGVALGLANGSVVLFSPAHGKIVKALSHSSSTSSIVSVTSQEVEDRETTQLWTSGADGVVRLWNCRDSSLLGSWISDERIPYSCLTIRPGNSDDSEHTHEVLAANYAIQLLAMEAESIEALAAPSKPSKLASFTGHASPVKGLYWASPSTFYSTAEADRFVYLWDSPAPDASTSEGRVAASIPLDSDVRNIAISSSAGQVSHNLLALSASGRVAVFPVPSKLDAPTGSKSKSKIPVLSPSSTITVSVSKKQASSRAEVISAVFVHGEDGKIRIARLSGGVKPVFDIVVSSDSASASWTLSNYLYRNTLTRQGN